MDRTGSPTPISVCRPVQAVEQHLDLDDVFESGCAAAVVEHSLQIDGIEILVSRARVKQRELRFSSIIG
jgi:hypothetical protein